MARSSHPVTILTYNFTVTIVVQHVSIVRIVFLVTSRLKLTISEPQQREVMSMGVGDVNKLSSAQLGDACGCQHLDVLEVVLGADYVGWTVAGE